MRDSVVNSRGTHKLTDDNTLGAVDYERTCLCHQRKISHEDFMFVDLIILFVVKSHFHFQRCGICRITFFTLVDRVLYFILAESEIDEFQTEMTAVICDRGNVIEHLSQTFAQKPLV